MALATLGEEIRALRSGLRDLARETGMPAAALVAAVGAIRTAELELQMGANPARP